MLEINRVMKKYKNKLSRSADLFESAYPLRVIGARADTDNLKQLI